MSSMQNGPGQDEGLTSPPLLSPSHAPMSDPVVPDTLEDDRMRDQIEAESVKYNVARIVRLSSGNFALFSHYRAGALDLIKVGTIEEIAPHIPSADECGFTAESQRGINQRGIKSAKLTTLDLADLGL